MSLCPCQGMLRSDLWTSIRHSSAHINCSCTAWLTRHLCPGLQQYSGYLMKKYTRLCQGISLLQNKVLVVNLKPWLPKEFNLSRRLPEIHCQVKAIPSYIATCYSHSYSLCDDYPCNGAQPVENALCLHHCDKIVVSILFSSFDQGGPLSKAQIRWTSAWSACRLTFDFSSTRASIPAIPNSSPYPPSCHSHGNIKDFSRCVWTFGLQKQTVQKLHATFPPQMCSYSQRSCPPVFGPE